LTTIGTNAASGTGPDQNVGTITAGGANNTPGELNLFLNHPSASAMSYQIDSQIADNGTGAVTVVKSGQGGIKLRGHNTYSGGTYLLEGRVSIAGPENA